MKTAVIYARYSSSNQTEQSIEGQIHVCQEFAKKNNIIIVDSYIDRAISGTTDNRDAFQKMLKDSDNMQWNYVLVYKLDRFARNKYEAAINRKYLKDNNVKLLSAMENIPESPEGALLESLLEGMNQYFSEELSQKINRGMHESRSKGICIGHAPFGYDKQDKKLVVNEEEAKIVKRIFQDYLSGKTTVDIERDFQTEGITCQGNKFSSENISRILHRESYTGIKRINGKVYDKIYPQIISVELFEKVNAFMDKKRYGCKKENHEVFKLRNKIICGYCGKKMYPLSAKSSNGKPLRYYVCHTNKASNCEKKRLYKDMVESCVDSALIELFNQPKSLEILTNLIYEKHKKSVGSNNLLITLKNNIEKTNKMIANLISAIEQGIITPSTKSRLEELETQREEIKEKIVIEESKSSKTLTKDEIQNYFKYILKECSTLDSDTFVSFVKAYNDKIEIGLNFAISPSGNSVAKKVLTKTFKTETKHKGNSILTKHYSFDIYVII